MWVVYVVRCADATLYCGITNDLPARLAAHEAGKGAKYTLAVPDYLHEAGLRDFADIARFREQLGGVIYGIEPGNDGNEMVLDAIRKNDFGLAGFKVVQSSEQGMLAQVERAFRAKQPVVFLAWAPHPMNTHFNVRYLTGGDEYFGPNFGAATVNTLARRGYLQECPNVGRMLQNITFSVELENVLMDRILTDKVSAADLARGVHDGAHESGFGASHVERGGPRRAENEAAHASGDCEQPDGEGHGH